MRIGVFEDMKGASIKRPFIGRLRKVKLRLRV